MNAPFRRRDRGSAAIELAIMAPSVLLFFAAVIVAGRYSLARQAGEAAAYDAARTASLARTEADARAQALTAALNSYRAAGLTCEPLEADVDAAGFQQPVGVAATVTVRVVCVARFEDISMPGIPGSFRIESSFTSPLDTYRSRT
ncbi:TadE/TadG family type IV pilus assembly protein [Catellatospora coxensis]|uniref:Membrane protein n=1 Tax=Catellatospora coxensis TaxID=310354 RepID=A0A8J3P772_9ACTN|nr:TadE family protein [Catellatospora coxensis]GIG04301.1 membrane protein [Catellatospora coxensis]